MKQKSKKSVLIVDDESRMAETLRDRLVASNRRVEAPYEFGVDMASSAKECIINVRSKRYDAIVLDVRMEEETSGLQASFQIYEELGSDVPVRIVFTGHPNYRHCVDVMRSHAWDYIVKEDSGDTSMFQIVVDSIVARLQQLDLRSDQEKQIAGSWLPQHFSEIQAQYGGKLVALWHEPEVKVIASGRDAFELEENLREWRRQHNSWQQPFIAEIPVLKR